MIINLNEDKIRSGIFGNIIANIKTTTFPDSHRHINIDMSNLENYFIRIQNGFNSNVDNHIKIICSITSIDLLFKLLQVNDILERNFSKYFDYKELFIPYLLGARYDRVINNGDSFDLKIIANLINSCNFNKVELYDVHSEVSTALINNSFNINNMALVNEYKEPDSILICPDAGAAKKVSKYFENKNIVDVVYCIKERDLLTGKISLKVLEPDKCKNKKCVIIDDICDGGGTFLAIADQIQPEISTLIVSHGIFSKGVDILFEKFNTIITSNSYSYNGPNKEKLKIITI